MMLYKVNLYIYICQLFVENVLIQYFKNWQIAEFLIKKFAYFQISKLRQVKFPQKIFPNLYIALFNLIDS